MIHNENIIKRLLDLWYDLIGGDHHKDRDCWFFIEREYCTYNTASWTVRHNGYILGDYQESFDTFTKAQEGLIEFLIEACAKEIDSISSENLESTRSIEYTQEKLSQLEKIVTDQHYIAETPKN